ncbi:YhaN family protein [Rhodopirellula halodulae]|uniref:YhaN family protein n=1 Tax=Rhodopirellula halodulae TaxID=2894198 RepID=UPI001E4EEDED|nr:YhaN family protein [Rhodopirellula sp. JC737]MCC9654244.1 AAA family ATPase [Rhodopirellula sp. JC737]
MIIERLDLIAFGHLTNRSLDLSAGPHRFHLVVGANESGKSTSLRAIASWLFGMKNHASSHDFLHPGTKLRVGGRLVKHPGEANEIALDCIRRKGVKGSLRGPDDKAVIEETELQSMLGGIDEAAFLSRFGLSYEELLRGGEQILRGEGELGEILFSAGAGIGRFRDILNQLGTEASDRFKASGKNPIINSHLKQIEEMRRELRDAQVPPAEFADLQQRVTEQETEIEAWRKASLELAKRIGRCEAAKQALPLIPRWRAASQEMELVGDAPRLSDDFEQRRREWENDHQLTDRDVQRLRKTQEELTQQLQEIGHDELIESFEKEILDLYRELPAREQAEVEKQTQQQALKALQRDMRSQLKDLAIGNADVEAGESGPANGESELADRVDSLQISDSQRTKIQRLAGEYEKLVQQRDDSLDQLDRAKRELQLAEEALEATDVSDQFQLLDRTLDEIGAPEHLIEPASRLQLQVEKLRRECQTTHRRLRLSGSNEEADWRAAVELPLPSASQLSDLVKALDQAEDEVRLNRSRLDESQRNLDSAEEKLASLKADAKDLPTPEDLIRAREHRDQLLASMKDGAESLSPEQWLGMIAEVELAVHQADSIADVFQSEHEAIFRRQSAQNQCDQAQQLLTKRQTTLDASLQQLSEAQEAWSSVWKAIGIAAESPETMNGWLTDHQKLIAQHADLLDACDEVSQAHSLIRQTVGRLEQALGVEPSGEAALETLEQTATELRRLHDLASTTREDQSQKIRLKEQRERKHDEFRTEIPGLESVLKRRQNALDDWNQQWDELTASLNLTSKPGPQDALSLMDAIAELVRKKKRCDEIQIRITEISNQTKTFSRRVIRLQEALQPDKTSVGVSVDGVGDESVDWTTLANIINGAQERLLKERSARSVREEVQLQSKQRKDELAAACAQMERLAITQQQLCDEAQCESPEQLLDAEKRFRRRKEAAGKLADLQAQLEHWAAGEDCQTFVDSLKDRDPVLVDEELRSLSSEKGELDQRIEDARETLGGLRTQLKSIDGSGKASALSQKLQFQLGKLQRESEEYVRIRLAASILQRAMDHYRNQNQEPVLKEAGDFFATLTCGEYQSLQVDYGDGGKPSLFGVRAGVDVPAQRMSTGTADALYLALRLASLKHQMANANAVPLIIDDCLIQLDDRRATAALQVFSELSKTTQVIMFTHHDHLIELAESALSSDQFHVHRLDGKLRARKKPSKSKATKKRAAEKQKMVKEEEGESRLTDDLSLSGRAQEDTLFDFSSLGED